MSTLDLWRSEWGTAYHQRNRFTPDQVRPVYDTILGDVQVGSVLEVGCGLGHNLMAIDALLRTGIEPNEAARNEANERYGDRLLQVIDGDVTNLPFSDGVFDLVLTCGLLIHIPPVDIQRAVEELVRVSSRYVLAIEYAAVEEEMVEYRGERDALWRRPYGKLLMAWGGMRLITWSDTDPDLYPGCSWWLMEKRTAKED